MKRKTSGEIRTGIKTHTQRPPSEPARCRAASWTAPALWRYVRSWACESARGLAQSKTLREHVWAKVFREVRGAPRWLGGAAGALVVFAFCIASPAYAATNDPTMALQKGLFEEEANHDFNAAIAVYQDVIKQFDQNRKLAATAVFRLGECYRKQGHTNEADVQYERIVREFPDQSSLVALSRSYLAAAGQSPVVEAAGAAPATSEEAEEVRRIRAMIKDSPDLINARDFAGNTPLSHAAEKGQLVVATFLLENGAEVNAANNNGDTPLHLAAAQGHKAMIELLLDHKADVQAMSHDNEAPTALHRATQQGFRSIVELLLAHKANVNARASDSSPTALHLAAARGFKAIAEVLLNNGANVNALANSISNPHGPNFSGTPLHIAAQRGDVPMAELLLANKADPNAKPDNGLTPLHVVAQVGSQDIAKLLIAHGAEVNARTTWGATPLALAVQRQNVPVAQSLLAAKADPNITFEAQGLHESPLYEATRAHDERPAAVQGNPNLDLVALLLQYGADPNLKVDANNPGGGGVPDDNTPLLVATHHQLPQIVKLLLAAKANPNVPSFIGATFPLHYAVAEPTNVEMLLSAQAQVDARDKAGETPLHWAAGAGLSNSAALLLEHGAAINAADNNGNTPLHFAVAAKRTAMVDFLLGKGANPNLPNRDGSTPLDWAKNGTGYPYSWYQIGNNASFVRLAVSRSGFRSAPPGFVAGTAPPAQTRDELAAALRSHGAVDELPHLDWIEVSRPGSDYAKAIFFKGTNDWNQFTALELIGIQYGLLTGNPEGGNSAYDSKAVWVEHYRTLPFPNLADLRLRHPDADLKTWRERKVDLTPVIESGDCSKDVPLAWGEVVQIPEADHPLNEQWQGFTDAELTNLVKCLSRQVTVVIKGKPANLVLGPNVEFYAPSPLGLPGRPLNIHTEAPLWLKPALRASNLLLASSDLSRIKVTRVDPASGEKHEWVLDCSDGKPAPAFWLKAGDVIDVPEKPGSASEAASK
ncbi:MAG TPA: ankyrin repeat domain-containing protein [Verrucomicrobiae bacterium]|nr:ankyrin repeat domain-containing protein [Verrucomicrobiae bacterium]